MKPDPAYEAKDASAFFAFYKLVKDYVYTIEMIEGYTPEYCNLYSLEVRRSDLHREILDALNLDRHVETADITDNLDRYYGDGDNRGSVNLSRLAMDLWALRRRE